MQAIEMKTGRGLEVPRMFELSEEEDKAEVYALLDQCVAATGRHPSTVSRAVADRIVCEAVVLIERGAVDLVPAMVCNSLFQGAALDN